MKASQKIVINARHGGFGLSIAAAEMLGLELEPHHRSYGYIDPTDLARDDEKLVAVVEALGDEASGAYSLLRVVEIPADVEWVVREYDGYEQVEEKHRIWQA